jgi:hypothetical protein
MSTVFDDFRQFSSQKLAFFLVNQCHDHFFRPKVDSKSPIFSHIFSAKRDRPQLALPVIKMVARCREIFSSICILVTLVLASLILGKLIMGTLN